MPAWVPTCAPALAQQQEVVKQLARLPRRLQLADRDMCTGRSRSRLGQHSAHCYSLPAFSLLACSADDKKFELRHLVNDSCHGDAASGDLLQRSHQGLGGGRVQAAGWLVCRKYENMSEGVQNKSR